MMLNYFKLSVAAFLSLVISTADGRTQQFGGSRSPTAQSVNQTVSAGRPTVQVNKASPDTAKAAKNQKAPVIDYGIFDNPQVTDNGSVVIPRPSFPETKDGSKRGDMTFIEIPVAGQNFSPDEDKELIFLYYENFEITRGFAGNVGCNVKFVVATTLNERLSNLSVKLKWPDMTTSLSFDDVNPNIATYYNYALFGEGCYNMDKIPNIIVNRCRIKGMSQQACAKKIRWLTKH